MHALPPATIPVTLHTVEPLVLDAVNALLLRVHPRHELRRLEGRKHPHGDTCPLCEAFQIDEVVAEREVGRAHPCHGRGCWARLDDYALQVREALRLVFTCDTWVSLST